MTLDDALVKFIEEERRERRWSQQELARRLGMTQTMLSRWLGGKRRVRNLQWYADLADRAFGIPLSLLVANLERRQAQAALEQEIAILRAQVDELMKKERQP
jgi:transcriptional regulator with XRE-family HTH domain